VEEVSQDMGSENQFKLLSKKEIKITTEVTLLQGGLSDKAWFETISFDESGRFENCRAAYVCCYDPAVNQTWSGVVDLDKQTLHDWVPVKIGQARLSGEECEQACILAQNDSDCRKALLLRGIEDTSKVLIEPWSAGHYGEDEATEKRIAYGFCWLMNVAGDNPYARPIANFHPVFDLASMEIIRVDDFGVVPIPPDPGPIRRSDSRDDLREIAITQPEGASFSVDGYKVKWHNWEVKIGFSQREGLVLHDIGYRDKNRLRSIMKRASMAEMVVPYGDPRYDNYRRNAFDTGEHGIGAMLDSLTLGCDCLGDIHYFDIWTHDWKGKPRLIKNAVCMHEEDYGIQWKYSVPAANQTTVTRSRRLVISSIATIGNYVYGFFWYFYMDGTIGVEIKATGIPFASAIDQECSPYGRTVADGIEAHVHQHVFNFRFEMAIDGEHNRASEINFRTQPMGEDNKAGNGILTEETCFKTELEAQREIDARKARYWRVQNPKVNNRFGEPVAYKLIPGANTFPFQHEDSSIGKRAGFMYKHFWVTPFQPDERYPAGWFPNQHPGGDGLPAWTAADRNIDDESIVVWYTLNYHHFPRPEDWPVQPVVYADFHWMPDGFFDENPTMDLPKK
jgi:primary-amine oxidase